MGVTVSRLVNELALSITILVFLALGANMGGVIGALIGWNGVNIWRYYSERKAA